MSEVTRTIVDFADDDNAKEMRDALYSAIHDRVTAHMDAHKQAIAKNIFNQQEEEQTEE